MIKLNITLQSKEPLEKLPASWPIEDLKALLRLLDLNLDAMNELPEVEEMCFMALAELPPVEAAELVLKYLLKNDLSPGQIANMSHEMLVEKMWEEYPDIALHENIYLANYLLYKAYNGKFPRPTAAHVVLKLENKPNQDTIKHLSLNDREVYFKILLPAFEENALVHRLYEDQIKNGELAEPSLFIWRNQLINEVGTYFIDIVASTHWLDDLLNHANYQVEIT